VTAVPDPLVEAVSSVVREVLGLTAAVRAETRLRARVEALEKLGLQEEARQARAGLLDIDRQRDRLLGLCDAWRDFGAKHPEVLSRALASVEHGEALRGLLGG
jgi:hypothetical protein